MGRNLSSVADQIVQELFLRIAFEKLAWFKFILEGYDGLCVLTTVDRTRGIVRLRFHGSSAEELFALLEAISPELSPYRPLEDRAG